MKHILAENYKRFFKESLNEELSEADPTSNNRELKKLEKLLKAASKQAEIVGVDSWSFPDNYSGTEALDIASQLKAIWAGLSTGDMNDESQNDEIFK